MCIPDLRSWFRNQNKLWGHCPSSLSEFHLDTAAVSAQKIKSAPYFLIIVHSQWPSLYCPWLHPHFHPSQTPVCTEASAQHQQCLTLASTHTHLSLIFCGEEESLTIILFRQSWWKFYVQDDNNHLLPEGGNKEIFWQRADMDKERGYSCFIGLMSWLCDITASAKIYSGYAKWPKGAGYYLSVFTSVCQTSDILKSQCAFASLFDKTHHTWRCPIY